ncbi:hemin receptor [Rhabdobacter roseus]|uniref:Uncharacterized protein n=1 Tax=Rhabdobacter roseus TaxID=1655419 RepID=A0A840TKR0_9BACT|nr:hypothetical protein [Rhabdobacter roseus]MBB5283525.1 hypothetical protein [Rhabdobacter roseus]
MKNNITQWIGVASVALLSLPASGQYAYDALRFSEINQTGTARFQAVGGNHTALGGDASSINGNPAGLGFYNRSELSLSPAFTNINTQSTYIDRLTTDGKTTPNLAHASLVIAGSAQSQYRKWKRTSIGISFSRQQSFQNVFSYSGRNNRSAYADYAVERANNRNISAEQLDLDYDPNTQEAFTTEGAYYQLYMINPSTALGPPYFRYDRDRPTDQMGTFESTGANTQWTFAYAGNYDDRLYVGLSLGFNRINYNYTNTLEDRFVNGTVFRGSTHIEDLNVRGNGFNGTLGLIYKASPDLQLGASITSPTFSSIRETFYEEVSADVIGIPTGNNQVFVPDVTRILMIPNDFDYRITSPLRASGGATYFLGTNGFLTGSVEYVGYQGMNVRTTMLSASDNTSFRNDTRREIQNTFKNTVNLRLGGEFRSGLFRARAGLAFLGDPYQERLDGINRSKLLYSAGVGVRGERFFADLTGTYNTFKSAFTPYVLNNPGDYASASIQNRMVNAMITVGTFF